MKHNSDSKHDARISEIIDIAKQCPDHLHINVFDEGKSIMILWSISMYCKKKSYSKVCNKRTVFNNSTVGWQCLKKV